MALRMRGMVSPARAAGAVRVALRAESLECVATPVLHPYYTQVARVRWGSKYGQFECCHVL
mgnify:CR=1 FL=1